MTGLAASRLPPWEAFDRGVDWPDLTIEQQRDELLAGTGLLLEWVSGLVADDPDVLERYIAMPAVLDEMGRRYGPWSR